MSDELLPCPICSGHPVDLEELKDHFYYKHLKKDNFKYVLTCKKFCTFVISDLSMYAAEKKWNLRATRKNPTRDFYVRA